MVLYRESERVTSKLIVAIDGPAGAGKSTISRLLAERIGVPYLNTGAMYRALSLYADENKIPIEEAPLRKALEQCGLSLKQDGPTTHVYLGDREVTETVREARIGTIASRVSVFPEVREEMVRRQRELGAEWGGVIEGRDIATVVFPEARFKFFLTATVAERANRRAGELQARGNAVDLNEIRHEVEDRDHRDASRSISPLQLAPGCVVVDTTGKTTGAVLDILVDYIDILR